MYEPKRPEEGVLHLVKGQPIFIGFKMDSSLARQLDSLEGPDRRYVSTENSDFLRICKLDGDRYVGKLIHERLTTDRVDDILRNISSILGRICPENRLPRHLEILACRPEGESADPPPGEEKW